MTLRAEVPLELWEQIESGEASVLLGRIVALEVCQEGGLLTLDRRVLVLEGMSGSAALASGVVEGDGFPIRAFIAPKEDTHGSDRTPREG